MKIYVGFSYPKNFKIGAAAISFWDNTKYSHVYLRFGYSGSKDAIFHAAHGMVHFKSCNNFFKVNNVVHEYEIHVTERQHVDLFDECMELAGEPYSTMQLLKLFITDTIYRITNKVYRFKDSPGYICSELVSKLCFDVLKIPFNKPAFLLKPKDVYEALKDY